MSDIMRPMPFAQLMDWALEEYGTLGSVFGVLVGFYLTFTGSYSVLTPMLLLTYLLLWVVPMLPLLWGVDKS